MTSPVGAERRPRRVLRPKPWFVAAILIAEIIFVAGTVFAYHQGGWTWVALGFAALSLVGLFGVAEVASARIVLSEDALEAGWAFSRRRYPVVDIASVRWEWGAGVSVKLTSGGWAKLPELGYNSQGLANTLRGWLTRVRAGAE